MALFDSENNVGQFGADNSNIIRYKQAAEYAEDARLYALAAAEAVVDADNLMNRAEELLQEAQNILASVENIQAQVDQLGEDVVAAQATIDAALAEAQKAVDQANTAIAQAQASQAAAAASASAAAGSASTATTQATNAANSASSANTSAGNASTSATNAANSASAASANADRAVAAADSIDTETIEANIATKANKGANSDITSLSGLTTPLSPAQGGTGNTTNQSSASIALVNARTFVTNLASTTAVSFNGTANNSHGVTGVLPITSGGTGAITAAAARTSLSAAQAGSNSDITSLSGFGTGVTLRALNSTEGLGNGVVFDCSNATESSFGITNTGGGTAVFHNYSKPPSGSGIGNGALIGGYGARPWTGATYSPHSTSAIHFMQDGTASTTNHGGWLRFVCTPLNSTVDNRVQPLAVSNNGDLWVGNDVPVGVYNMNSFTGTTAQTWDSRGLKQLTGPINEVAFLTPAKSSTPSVTIRGIPFGGTVASKTVTPGGSAVWVGLGGYNGSDFTGLASSIRFTPSSSQDWSASNTGAGIVFSTTALNTTTRVDRWAIGGDGSFTPLSDGVVSLGQSGLRLNAIYATNGTIQTSDARLKSEIRGFTETEIEAAKLLGKEIGFFSWIAKQQEEGDSAREHVGFTVQRAIEIMSSLGLDPLHYGFICHDSWEEREEVDYYEEDNNSPVYKTVPAGDRYSFRYDQLNLFIARGFEARLSALENK